MIPLIAGIRSAKAIGRITKKQIRSALFKEISSYDFDSIYFVKMSVLIEKTSQNKIVKGGYGVDEYF